MGSAPGGGAYLAGERKPSRNQKHKNPRSVWVTTEVKEGFTFKQVDRDGVEVVMTVPTLDLAHTDLIELFVSFLRGCGFIIPHD